MSLQPDHRTALSKAETAFREAFDPSALRKSRYPALIAEIQRWLATNRPQTPVSERQTLLSQRKRNRSLNERIEDMKTQRDSLVSLLVEADAKILELTLENARLRAQVPSSKVTPIHQGSSAAA
jgi:hypothetical protein